MIIWYLLSILSFAENLKILDRKMAFGRLEAQFGISGKTFFCNCDYFKNEINLKNCGFSFDKYYERQKKVEWIPVVPLESFARSFPSYFGHKSCVRVDRIPTRPTMRSMHNSISYLQYTSKPKPFRGIECVRKVDELFNRMENDLYNLVPEVGAINVIKEDAQLADLELIFPQFGKCQLKIINNLFTPPPSMKGDVARIFLYMSFSYPNKIKISQSEKRIIEAWNILDPVSPAECKRAKRIKEIQGNPNSFVEKFCGSK